MGNAVAMPWYVYIVASLTASTTTPRTPQKKEVSAVKERKKIGARTGLSASQRTCQSRAERAPDAMRAIRVQIRLHEQRAHTLPLPVALTHDIHHDLRGPGV
jgi:hypothetical protein